ncbi:hypothetical protein Taro_006786 [Colocasia esculenta]|uniref:DNA repair metallo-beta-lactamase domain-containing protein n=1 Tax=Colocasia esculenta TaxID=4460 RepID=A0A843TPQ4_COLES|nr:hypothetical protein [Colocasia esculenta]
MLKGWSPLHLILVSKLRAIEPHFSRRSIRRRNRGRKMDTPAAAIDLDAGDHLSPPRVLDENGFPFLPFSSSDEEEGAAGEEAVVADGHLLGSPAVAGTSGFAADFYSGGTDWSCLVEGSDALKVEVEDRGNDCSGERKKTLVQRNLFQMWGIGKPSSSAQGSQSRALVPSIKRRRRAVEDAPLVGEGDPVSQRRGSNGEGSDRRRACPFYKKIPGTRFTVDAFRYGLIDGCSAYFLSHFHHDHYGGLSKKWTHGTIYCSPLTARLVQMCLSVNSSYICPLELDTEHAIEGVKVTLLEANHCPGAVLIHFRLADGRCYLHTGDFRASKLMQSHAVLSNKRVNILFLDTTYCNPNYRFPPKEDVVDFIVRISQDSMRKQPRTLIVVGAYSIGKENVYLAIAQALRVQIYANAPRRRVLETFNWPELSKRLCTSAESSPLHVLPISFLRHDNLDQYLKKYGQLFTSILAFRPTGWTYSKMAGGHQLDLIKPSMKGSVRIYGVPYSEHSSFTELRDFVQFLRPERIIPTVNVSSAASRERMQAYFREWLKP